MNRIKEGYCTVHVVHAFPTHAIIHFFSFYSQY